MAATAASASFALCAALFANFAGSTLTGSDPTSGHIDAAATLTLEQQPTAAITSTNPLAPHYEAERSFLSEVYSADTNFQLLGLNWTQDLPASTAASMEIRFQDARDNWTDWEEIELDQDGAEEGIAGDQLWTYILTDDSVAFQYKAYLSTVDESVTPKLADISFDYVAGGNDSLLTGMLSKASDLTRLVFDSNSKIQDRDDWGANDSYLLAKNHVQLSSSTSYDELDEDDLEDDPEMRITRTEEEDEDGNELWWAQEYPEEVKKIVIHHTATTDDLDDPEQAIRAIYYYHAMTRGWGDIGYNYIIAPDGTVYQGRAGDDGVVAGHSAGYNTGSVGIALLGDYSETPVAAEAAASLMDLIYEKSQVHDIDPDGYAEFRGESMANIIGHRDVGSTACPGEYVYNLLEDIRESVGASLDNRRHSNFEDDYSYEEVNDVDMLALDPQDKGGISFKIKNTGTKTWNSDTFLTVNADSQAEEIAQFDKDTNKSVAEMKESSVKPGSTATFSFTVESGLYGGLAHFDVSPIFNGEEKTLHYMDLAVYVEQPFLAFDVEEEDAPSLMKPGQKTDVTVVLENEGNVTWERSGDQKVTLAVQGSTSLTSKTTLATMEEDEAPPGDEATFTFEITAPRSGGTYTLYFAPEMDSGNAITASSSRLSVKVTATDEDAAIIDHSSNLDFIPGENRFVWLQIKNQGIEKWDTSDLDFDFEATPETSGASAANAASDFSFTEPRVTVKSLSPGAAGKVYFDLTVPSEPGDYTIEVMPSLGKNDLLDSPYELDITVGDVEVISASEYEDPIRIKLTPDTEVETPIVTSKSSFSVYDDDELIHTFAPDSRFRITPLRGTDSASAGDFKVSVGSYVWYLDGPVRVSPNSQDAYIRIMNMNQVAAWDTSVNDNKFRGTIELRYVDGEAILINELPLEDYLLGVAEETNTTPVEKLKTMSILARSYAYFYMTQAEKFPGMPYHLDDDPATSQKYLGYGYELRHPNVSAAAEETAGMIVTYNDTVVKTPYFSQSDGVATKSAQSVWGWTSTPYLQSVADTYCEADSFWGHGVGLSGCGAKGMADSGFTFEEIIKYYYTGVDIDEIK